MVPNAPLRDEVATKLRNEILRGQYRVGERLPSERDLAERFGVNRGCVREALKTLEQLGLADIRKGGARVMPLQDASLDILGPLLELEELPDPELVEQLLEVFESLMPVAVRRTLERGSEQELQRFRELLEQIGESTSDTDYLLALHEMSELWVEASGNLVLRLVVRGLGTRFMGRLHAAGVLVPPSRSIFAPVARELKEALERRDPAAASATCARLMQMRREYLLKDLVERRARSNGGDAGSAQ